MAQKSNGLSATVDLLPLVKGMYLFSVKAAYSHRMGDDTEIVLPALQVGVAPGTSRDNLEIMYGPRTESGWLCEPRDVIVVNVKEPSTVILLTSMYAVGMTPLELEVRRLDNPNTIRPSAATGQATTEYEPAAAPRPQLGATGQGDAPARPLPPINAGESVKLKVVTHVQYKGDIEFKERQWAGLVGQRLAIESFTLAPTEAIDPSQIEYKGITATGIETAWISGGNSCGTRGLGIPLIGLAVRAKSQSGGPLPFTCEYGVTLVSGTVLPPARDGEFVRSPNGNDPIEGLWFVVSPPNTNVSAPVRQKGADSGIPSADQIVQERQTTGPRFSLFREPVAD